MEKKHCTAIILAAGSGKRMNSTTAKQFMTLCGKPIVWYSLNTVEQSQIVEDCVVVTGEQDINYVRQEIVQKYGFQKVRGIIAGGSERWESVANALAAIERGQTEVPDGEGYIFIHDGARPFLSEKILQSTLNAVEQYGACVAAVPSKDTVKLSDEAGFAAATPDRRSVWSVQTPQVFERKLITKAYEKLMNQACREGKESVLVTDDAGVVELFTDRKVYLAEGSYQNIKITTPEDLKIAEVFLKRNGDKYEIKQNCY